MATEEEELLLRQLPHSTEAEQAVLGSMLIDPRCVPEVIDKLRPDDFYLQQNRDIYETIYSMFNYSMTIDPVTVLENMKQNGVYDENQSRGYLLQLMDTTPTAANVKEYIDILKDNTLQRRVAETAGDLLAMVRQGSTPGRTFWRRRNSASTPSARAALPGASPPSPTSSSTCTTAWPSWPPATAPSPACPPG